ncbi:hypothetical protein F511_16134 [Dorcoceras hygrometricum]|uniref:Uncharacterized protein n=1 Tax=Dorcoceras hygrometricum TaxID=472368 RepID=A0A2Z7DFZ8_9LAMI|nr:hypothetical protein F511_16134 [Dorcoceras hygrometricum]
MGRARDIMRRSIFTFLKDFQLFTLFPCLIAFSYAVSVLMSQSLVSSSHVFVLIHGRMRSLFLAAGIPPSSEIFAFFNLKLSETVFTFLIALPFSFSFLLLAKASVIRALDHRRLEKSYPFSSWLSEFNTLCVTQLWNSLVMLSANATSFCILSISFNLFDVLGLSSKGSILLLSATGLVIYSIVLANSYITCKLALVLSGMEKQGGFASILKAFFLIRGRTLTALSLAVTLSLGLAAIEALFQYRVAKAYHESMTLSSSMVLEGMLVSYLYSILLVLDTVNDCVFVESCRNDPPERLPIACIPRSFSRASLNFLADDRDQVADQVERRKDNRHPQMEMY